jgi:hypothetical protein
VAAYDKVARAALDAVLQLRAAGQIEPDLIGEEAGVEVWDAALSAPPWPEAGVWVHRDLMGAISSRRMGD